MRGTLLFVAASFAICAPISSGVRAEEGLSGHYGEMLLSVRGDQVNGAFATSRGIDPYAGGPMFTCAFLLQGRLIGGRVDVVSWTPGDTTVIKGGLTLEPTQALLRLRANQPGCGMAAGLMTQEDHAMRREGPGTDWIGVGMVGARRAVLQGDPRQGARQTPYLVRYDAVAILRRQPGWARVRFFGNQTPLDGWLREAELVPYAAWPTREAAP